MKKFFKYLLLIITVLVVAAIIFVKLFDFNDYKPQIEKLIYKYANVNVKINGNLSVAVSWWPTIEINEVVVTLPDGAKVADISYAQIQFSVQALLHKELEIDILETNNTEIFYNENESFTIHSLKMDMDEPVDPIEVEFATSLYGVGIEGEGTISSWKDLQQNSFNKLDVDAEIRALGYKMLFKGVLDNLFDKISASGTYNLAYNGNKINGSLEVNLAEEIPYIKLDANSDKIDIAAFKQTAHNNYLNWLVGEAYAEEYIFGTTVPYSYLQQVNADVSLNLKKIIVDKDITVDNLVSDISLKDGKLKADIKQAEAMKMKISGIISLDSPKTLPYVKLNIKGDVVDLQKLILSSPSKKIGFLNMNWLIREAYAEEYIFGTTVPYSYLQQINADVSLNLKKIIVDKDITVDNLVSDISLKNGKLKADIKQAETMKMKISGSVGLDSPKTLPYAKLNIKGDVVDLQKLILSSPSKKIGFLNMNWLIGEAYAASFMPATEIPYQYLRMANGNVKLNLQKIIVMPDVVLSDVQADFTLQNGFLKTNISNVNVGNGKISGTIGVDAKNQKATANLNGTNIVLQNLYKAWSKADNKDLYIKEGGLINALINLETNGRNTDDYLRNLNGQILLLADKSVLRIKGLERLQGNIIVQILQNLKLNVSKKEMHLKCAVVRSDIQNGRMNFPKGIVWDATDLYFVANGNVNLSNEKINLAIQSFSGKISGINISSVLGAFLEIRGTIAHPQLSINKDTTAKSVIGAVATGGVYNVGDMMLSADHAPCHTALEKTVYADHFKADNSVRNSVSQGYNNTQETVKGVVKSITKGTKKLKNNIKKLFQ